MQKVKYSNKIYRNYIIKEQKIINLDQIYRNFLKLLKMNYKKINSIKNKYGKFNSNELNYI